MDITLWQISVNKHDFTTFLSETSINPVIESRALRLSSNSDLNSKLWKKIGSKLDAINDHKKKGINGRRYRIQLGNGEQ